MEIKAKLVKAYDSGKVKAIFDVILDDKFAVHGVKLIAGSKSDYIAMPYETWKKHGQVQRADVANPLDKETRIALYRAVTDAYLAHTQAVPQASGPGELPFS